VKKNHQSKKFKENYENVYCILLFGGLESIDFVGGMNSIVTFEEIINNRIK
jgi:hypothetical protein